MFIIQYQVLWKIQMLGKVERKRFLSKKVSLVGRNKVIKLLFYYLLLLFMVVSRHPTFIPIFVNFHHPLSFVDTRNFELFPLPCFFFLDLDQ